MEDANEVLPDKTYELLDLNGNSWDCIGDSEWCGTSLPDYGPFTVGEESLNLFGDLENKTVLEIACGDGRSLLFTTRSAARGNCGDWISLPGRLTKPRLCCGRTVSKPSCWFPHGDQSRHPLSLL